MAKGQEIEMKEINRLEDYLIKKFKSKRGAENNMNVKDNTYNLIHFKTMKGKK